MAIGLVAVEILCTQVEAEIRFQMTLKRVHPYHPTMLLILMVIVVVTMEKKLLRD